MSRRISLVTLLLAAGCSPISVSHDYDSREDFSRLKTWSWVKPDQAQGGASSEISSLNQDRIRRAVHDELGFKGYSLVNSNPDFLVQTYTSVGQRIEVEPGYQWGWYGNEVQVYDEGTLVIDVFQAKEKRLVWRGTASEVVDPRSNLSPEERDARIQEAVQKVLADFPPKK